MNIVKFFLNGKMVTLENPSPDLLLLDYLRSEEVGLTGAKKGCGQGGCGACTVILSQWNEAKKKAEHRSINSCLRPVCALEGLAVTTVEGTGSVTRPEHPFLHHIPVSSRAAAPPSLPASEPKEVNPLLIQTRRKIDEARKELLGAHRDLGGENGRINNGMNPVAHRLAINNGTQCGYCTVGWVMNMSAFLAENPTRTKREIEDIFDGNICRCTGYRAILTGMKTFASDWTAKDETNRMKCQTEDSCEAQPQLPADFIPFPDEAEKPPQPVEIAGTRQIWHTPATLGELGELMKANRDKTVRLLHGNTSYGIYKEEFHQADLLVDIRLIPDLYGVEETAGEIRVGASVSYTHFLDYLKSVIEKRWKVSLPNDLENPQWNKPTWATSAFGIAHFMAHRTAGMIVRNAASIGGNTMLTLKHIHEGEPFPSDLLTALTAVNAKIEILQVSNDKRSLLEIEEIVDKIQKDAGFADDIVLIRYHIPAGEKSEIVLAQKVALREVNSHSIVNAATNLSVDKNLLIEKSALVFGGIAPFPWRAGKTEAAMNGKTLSLELFEKLEPILKKEVENQLKKWIPRMKGLISEGFTDEYKTDLAVSFLYKAIVNALVQRKVKVPENLRSSGEITWGRWAVSDGTQYYATQDKDTDPNFKAPVGQPYIKLMAMYQASGQVHYTHEISLPPNGVNAAFVQSRRALSDYHFIQPETVSPISADRLREHLEQKFPDFVDLITHSEVPAQQYNLQGMGSDQPIFAVERVSYAGQSIALVLAKTEQKAIDIAAYVTEECVGYTPVDWGKPWNPKWNKPVLSLDQAIEMNSIFPDAPSSAAFVSHIWKITRPGSRFDWMSSKKPLDKKITSREAKVDGIHCRIVENTQTTGGQAHFYMETQACVALPTDGDRLLVHPSTQSPMEMHQTTAMALNMEYNRIDVQVQQVGGGFGGKTEQARFVTGAAVVAAKVKQKPVRLVMPRDEDTRMIGKRHPYYGQYQIAVDLGENDPRDKGLIRGMNSKLWGDGGAFYDCSYIVSNCIQLRMDNAYKVPNFESQIDVCRTNTAPNTAMRAFGDVQAMLIVENAIDDAAYAVGMPPEELREKNMYERGDVTPFGQALSYCYMKEVWNYLKEQCKFAEKRRRVNDFNARNKWRKRGLCMLPVKYGNGYNIVMLEQAVAVVSVYANDGSIVIHQGGVDMGQGLITQINQIASYILNIPMELIYVEKPKTSVIPNPTSTGGSTGTSYSGEAVKRACENLRRRLMEFGYEMLKVNGDYWCKSNGIDFWNYGKEGWAASTPETDGTAKLVWQNLVAMAWQNRVSLVSTFTAPITGGETPVPAMTFKPKKEQPNVPGIVTSTDEKQVISGIVDSFTGFTYSAACSEVELDVLTGEVKILSSDIVYDMGWSLNPALDIGQVEGAFVQGIGYVLTEKLVFEPDGEEKGRLNSDNTWRYKPPAVSTIPLQMNTYLFPRNLAADVPENPNSLLSSKEVGEPPLVLANSVFFAVKAAVRASRIERGLDGLFRLDAPATVQEVRRACKD